VALVRADDAREQGRRTTGRQGDDSASRSIVEPLTPEAWRDLSASDDEDLGTGATWAPAFLCRFPLPTGLPSPWRRTVTDSRGAASRYFFAIARYSSRFHAVRCCTT